MATLWDIDHETGDLSQYDSTVTDGGDLSVTNAAALAGTSWGLSCELDDTTAIYGEKNQGDTGTGKYRIRFYIDLNGLTIPDTKRFSTSEQQTTTPGSHSFATELRSVGGVYKASIFVYNDAGYLGAHVVDITDDVHYIEVYLQQASDAVAADGSIEWWLDGVSQNAWNNVDNFDNFANMTVFRLGATSGIDAGTLGTFYLDQLKANDDGSEIGAHVPAVTGVRKSNRIWIEHPERFTGLRRYSIY